MGLRVAKQSCLGCPFHEVGSGLQILAWIGHAMAVQGVGEIERQIPAEKFIVHVEYCNLYLTVDRLHFWRYKIVTSIYNIRGYDERACPQPENLWQSSLLNYHIPKVRFGTFVNDSRTRAGPIQFPVRAGSTDLISHTCNAFAAIGARSLTGKRKSGGWHPCITCNTSRATSSSILFTSADGDPRQSRSCWSMAGRDRFLK